MSNRTSRLITAGIMALCIAGPATAQPSPFPPVSPQSQEVINAWVSFLTAHKAMLAALPPATTVSEELARRVALDQAARQSEGFITSRLPDSDPLPAIYAIWRQMVAIDADNTAYLKSVLPADGWFRKSRDGEEAGRSAWVLVQHSPDDQFMKQVLAAMEPLVQQGGIDGPGYALLYDRTEVEAGRPQRYGSQSACKDGIWIMYPIEAAAKVDELRRQIGLRQSLAEYNAFVGIGKPC